MGEVYGLFPTPIWISKIDRELIKGESDFILAQEQKKNEQNICSRNLRVLDHLFLSKLRNEIYDEISKYIDNVICPKNKIEIYITQSWINWTSANQSHYIHNHPNSLISGVYYIDVIKDQDYITFYRNKYSQIKILEKEANPFNCSSWDIPVEKGSLLLFPSEMLHSVKPLKEDYQGTRVSLAFNTFVRGNIGNDSEASGLNLQ